MRLKCSVLALAVVLAGATSASAALINFNDPAWAGANGHNTFTLGDITLTAAPSSADLTQGADGLGVYYRDRTNGLGDEIDSPELLTISFAVPYTVTNIYLTNLFRNEVLLADERGAFSVNGGSWTSFEGTSSNGNLVISLGAGTSVNTLTFRAGTTVLDSLFSDYSVQGIDGVATSSVLSSVPEPTSLLLLGLGLLGLTTFVRRRR